MAPVLRSVMSGGFVRMMPLNVMLCRHENR